MEDSSLNITEAQSLQQLFVWSQGFPDFPKNFSLPQRGPNYVPAYRGTEFIFFNVVSLGVMLVIVLGRLAIRLRQKKFGWDDWLLIPALLCSLTFVGLYVVLPVEWGVGKHVYDLELTQLKMAEKTKFIEILIYDGAVYFTKMSIVAFLFRFVEPGENKFRMTLIMTCMALSVILLGSVVIYAFACTPIHASWDVTARLSPEAHCLNLYAFLITLGVLYSLADFWLLLLPIKTVWDLKLPKSSKWGLIFLFSLGIIACVASLVKLIFIGGLYNTWDPTWNSIPSLWGSSIEVTVGIIVAALPGYTAILFSTVPRRWRTLLEQTFERPKKKSDFSLLNTAHDESRRPARFRIHKGRVIPKASNQGSTLNLTKWDFGIGSTIGSIFGSKTDLATDRSQHDGGKAASLLGTTDSGIGTSVGSYIDIEKLQHDVEKPARVHYGRSPLWMSSTNSLHHTRSLSALSYHRSISQMSREDVDSRMEYHPVDGRATSQRSESALSQRALITAQPSSSKVSHQRSASQLSSSQYNQSYDTGTRSHRSITSAGATQRSQSTPRSVQHIEYGQTLSHPTKRSSSARSTRRTASQRRFYLKPPIESPISASSSASTAAAVAALIPNMKSPNLNPFSDPSTYSPAPPPKEVEVAPQPQQSQRPPTNNFGVIEIGMAV